MLLSILPRSGRNALRLWTILTLSVLPLHGVAQRTAVRAWLDSVYVVIGMPTTIHLEAVVPEGQDVGFPQLQPGGVTAYDDTLAYVLEYADVPHVDTVDVQGGMVTLREDIGVFAFDSATLYIPAFKFAFPNGDTLTTGELALKVIVPFEVEVDPQKFFDIKDVVAPRFVLMDYAAWILWPLGLLLLAAVVLAIVLYIIHRKRAPAEVVEAGPKLPPHEVALSAIDALEARKLWQNGQHKAYHTELTGILRTYIEERFGVPALERTTDEILDGLDSLAETQRSSLSSLRQMLTLADLVKFAKYEPLVDENRLSAVNARMFVTQTKSENLQDNDLSQS